MQSGLTISQKRKQIEEEALLESRGALPSDQRKLLERGLLRLGYQTYWQYLCSPSWRAFRARNLGRVCVCCKARGKSLLLHHVDYSHLGRERRQDVVTLCRTHHRLIHAAVEQGGDLRGFAPGPALSEQELSWRRTRLALLGMPSLKAYYSSDFWRSRRDLLIAEQCERCGWSKSEHLRIYHATYERLGAELPEDLETLCKLCHRLDGRKAA